MDNDGFLIELALVALLILLNGFFAGAEIAIVSARRARLQPLADEGNRRAQAALRLKGDPDRFLATVQIGVTVVGTLASAVGGVAAIERLEPIIAALPNAWARSVAEPAAVSIVVFTIAYLSLVVGELAPKSIAVRNAETIALWIAPVIEALNRVSRPAVAVLTASSRLLLRLVGQKDLVHQPFHTLDDLRAIAEEAAEQGIVEQNLVSGALEFHEREVREVLTPRPRIKALPVDAGLQQALRAISESGHTRLPVYEGALDNALGFVYARDVYETALRRDTLDLRALVRHALIVPATKLATELLADMRKHGIQMGLVVDEHGALIGLVTLEDLVEVIVGEIRDEHTQEVDLVKVLPDGVLEVDGSIPVHELNSDHELELPESPDYVTVAGLVMERLGTIPREGDAIVVSPYRIQVLALAGHRIARMRIETMRAPVLAGDS